MAATNPIPLVSSPPLAANDIRDIKPPVAIPGWEWLWWTLAGLAIAALLVWAWRYWRKRRTQVPLVPPIPAHIRAKQKLQEALALLAQPKPFCILVSDTIRGYLEERFNFHAPERTTEEFLYELQGTDLLTRDQKESLGEFLQCCDLVKFARYEPGEPELRDLHDSALRLVEETEPPEPIPTPPSTSPAAEAASALSSPYAESSEVLRTATSEKGKKLAVLGTLLQLAPSAWLVAYLAAILRSYIQILRASPGDLATLLSRLVSVYTDALVIAGICWTAGLVGLVLISIALVISRYRAEWFFWFLLVYGVMLLVTFPCIGTAIGIFLIVYCLSNRRDFLNQGRATAGQQPEIVNRKS